MKKTALVLALFIVCFLVYAHSWDEFNEMKYSKFTEKIYKTVRKTNSYDEYGKIIDRVNHDQRFESSKFAYVQDRTDFPVVTFDIFIGYKDGWITTDDIILVDSDTIPDSILTTRKYFFEKKWVPSWYNKIIHSNKMLDDYSERYKNNKTFEEYYFAQIHNIEFRNTVLVFLDTDGESYFSIKNIRKKNNVYYIYCELAKNAQAFFNDFDKESFNNLPDLRVRQDAIFIVEQNGNRLRVYNGESKKLIIELMQTNQEWIGLMLKYINSEYKNKPSNLKVIEEKLEHPWSNPVTGLYDTSVRSGEAAAFSNAALKKTMSVKENLKLRSGEATTTSVLAVMSAGTRVKILTLGKQATIDGITSNWVQVEVQADAKDRDGKAIAAGTTGWCFGGYLTER